MALNLIMKVWTVYDHKVFLNFKRTFASIFVCVKFVTFSTVTFVATSSVHAELFTSSIVDTAFIVVWKFMKNTLLESHTLESLGKSFSMYATGKIDFLTNYVNNGLQIIPKQLQMFYKQFCNQFTDNGF